VTSMDWVIVAGICLIAFCVLAYRWGTEDAERPQPNERRK